MGRWEHIDRRNSKSKDRRKETGLFGEQLALSSYLADGYLEITRNWRLRNGEIDLIMRSPTGQIVFVEVRSRVEGSNHKIHSDLLLTADRQFEIGSLVGAALESVTLSKQRTIRQVARHFLHQHPWDAHSEIRFDVVVCIIRRNPSSEFLEAHEHLHMERIEAAF